METEKKGNGEVKKGIAGRLTKVFLWTAGIWIALTLIAEVALTSPLTTRLINRYASEYIDGDISFGRASVSMLRDFPAVNLQLEDLTITYPSDRFDRQEKQGPQGMLMYRGCGIEADTLASFRHFSASINAGQLLLGRISIPEIELSRPRIFAHAYHDGSANWNIFRIPGSSDTTHEQNESDTASAPSPLKIILGKIRLTDRPRIVYTDSRDTVFATISLRKAGFDGRLSNTGKASRNRIGLTLDSMFVAGRLSRDTLALRLDRLHIHEHDRHMDVHASAKTLMATRAFGRMNVPVEIEATLHQIQDTVPAIGIHDFKADIAAIPFTGKADLRFHEGRTGIEAQLSVSECEVNDLIQKFIKNFIPEAGEISTDAVIALDAICSGEFSAASGTMPAFSVYMSLPESTISHKSLPEKVDLALYAYAAGSPSGKVDLSISEAKLRTAGLDFDAKGKVRDMLSEDPLISIEGSLDAALDSLARFLPDTSGVTAGGRLHADLNGSARMSQLNLYSFSHSSLSGSLTAEDISMKSATDTIDISIKGIKIKLGPEERASRRDSSKTRRLMALRGSIDKVDVAMKESMAVSGSSLVLSAVNPAAQGKDTSPVKRIGGRISAENLTVTDASGMSLELDRTENSFRMHPQRENPVIPVLSLNSTNDRITLVTEVNRAILTDASVKAEAAMNSIARRKRIKDLRDSLAREYPDIPYDSLFRHLRARRPAKETPQWMSEEDFRKSDIDIRLDQTLAKYFRDWDLHGDISVRTGIIMTPYFPLRNILRGMEVCFTNDRIAIDSLKVMSGKSEIEAKGELKGLRRALAGRSGNRAVLDLDLDISTDKMNANELLTAYNSGARFNPESAKDQMAEASNAEFLKMVTSDTSSAHQGSSLIVIPANLNADIRINGKDIKYSDLDIHNLTANLIMKERCVQITNTIAASNIGDVDFEGFYATRTKKDIKAGFSFNFKDITAEKAIDLMPAIDTVMPLLSSFAGLLNCELAATASLDTNMNIITPTINGVLRISGNDLTISDSEMFTSLAKKLKFDNSKTGKVKKMKVEGVIKENVLEVFPFIISLDRYTLALSGKQNLDMSYRYHASLIKSPLVIRVGVDLYGKDFDNMNFKIVKPKYKNEKVPVFSSVIDQTRINLVESIKGIFTKGVEAAIQENERQAAINERREEIGFVNAVDQETEELSTEEKKQLESSEVSETTDAATVTPGAEENNVTTENNQ